MYTYVYVYIYATLVYTVHFMAYPFIQHCFKNRKRNLCHYGAYILVGESKLKKEVKNVIYISHISFSYDVYDKLIYTSFYVSVIAQ